MKQLKERILKDGKCLEGGILKVDSFINHQMDAKLMMEMAKEIVDRFKGTAIDKVITIEASGIAPAIMVAYLLDVPDFVFKGLDLTEAELDHIFCKNFQNFPFLDRRMELHSGKTSADDPLLPGILPSINGGSLVHQGKKSAAEHIPIDSHISAQTNS